MTGFIYETVFTINSIMNEDEPSLLEAEGSSEAALINAHYGKNRDFKALLSIGNDEIGLSLKELMLQHFSERNLTIIESKSRHTPLRVLGDLFIKDSSLSTIEENDIISFIDNSNINTLFLSAVLLSFPPLSKIIVSSLAKRKDKISILVVDTRQNMNILLLEELRDSIIEIKKNYPNNLILLGDTIYIEGVKNMGEASIEAVASSLL